nr:hyp [Cotesia vestalis bracovirus]
MILVAEPCAKPLASSAFLAPESSNRCLQFESVTRICSNSTHK